MFAQLTLNSSATLVFWKILTSASKFSEEVTLEFSARAILLRFTSLSRTTYLSVEFPVSSSNIFTKCYKYSDEPNESHWAPTEYNATNGVHINCKPLAHAIKPNNKYVILQCTLEYDSKTSCLYVRNRYTKGLTKTFELHIAELPLENPSDEQCSDCTFECDAKHLSRMLELLPSNMRRFTITPKTNTVDFRGELMDSSDVRSMDSDASISTENFLRYYRSPKAAAFSKTLEPKGFKVFTELAAYLNLQMRVSAGPGMTPVMLHTQASLIGMFSMRMLIASYDLLGLQAAQTPEDVRTSQAESSVGVNATEPMRYGRAADPSASRSSSLDSRGESAFIETPVSSQRSTHAMASQRSIAAEPPAKRPAVTPLSFSQVLSQKTPAPIISASQPNASLHTVQNSMPQFESQALVSQSLLHSPLPNSLDEQSAIGSDASDNDEALQRRYAEGEFPLQMDPKNFQSARKENLHLSLSSYYGDSDAVYE